jgi:hypothetical protein
VRQDGDVSFDVREFVRTAVGSHRDGLELNRYDERPLGTPALRCLRYLRDLERATMRYLRRVLVTPTHKDARITAFLTTWAYEKYWVADAIDAVLERHGYEPPPSGPPQRWTAAWRRARERYAPIGRSLVDNTLGENVIAVHLATGTIHEWLIEAAYERVAQLEGHPELTRAVAAIGGVKARHIAFFASQTADRLRRSSMARHLTWTRLRRARWPVSVADEPAEEEAFFFGRVFVTAPALVDEVDRRIQALPGLERLSLLRTTVAASTRGALSGAGA